MTLEKAEELGLVSDQVEPQLLVGLMDQLLMYYLLLTQKKKVEL